MEKQTSNLNFRIIDFVRQDQEVQRLLDARDIHVRTFGMQLRCSFRRAIGGPLSEYLVEFIYEVGHPGLERNDDVSVLVEVRQGGPSTFRILSRIVS